MVKSFNLFFSGDIEEDLRPDDISLDKNGRTGNRTVDMCFRGEMSDTIRAFHRPLHNFTVADIAFDKPVSFIFFDQPQVLQISGVCEFVEINDLHIRIFPEHI